MRTRSLTLLATASTVGLVVAPMITVHEPRLLWNASASVPIGLYSTTPATSVEVGDLVTVMPPDDLAAFLAERGYLPRGVSLIKRVLVLPGAEVCRLGTAIVAYDRIYGVARDRDNRGRHLPRWQGCRKIADGELFLMNWNAPDSLDGRYFGPLLLSSVTARLAPLWTDQTGDGRFEWRTSAR